MAVTSIRPSEFHRVLLINTLRNILASIDETPEVDPNYPGLTDLKSIVSAKLRELKESSLQAIQQHNYSQDN